MRAHLVIPVLLVLLISATAVATRLSGRQASQAQVRRVAHSLFSFERVNVKNGAVHRQQLTRGYFGQHELQFRSGKHVKANAMLNALFGAGEMRVQQIGAKQKVVWRGENGKRRTLGTLQRVGKETVFQPTTGTRRHRNAALGEMMRKGLEATVTGKRHGYWASWVDKTSEKTTNTGHSKHRYQAGQTPPHGQSYYPSSHGLLESATRNIAGLGDVLQPVWSSDGGKTKGGLSVSWTTRQGGQSARHRLIFRPDGWRPGGTMQALFGMLTGGDNGQQGGANYSKEVFTPGAKRQRDYTRKEKKAAVGWVKDQQKRWKHLGGNKARAALSRESAVIRGLLQLGTKNYDDKPVPTASGDNPPNLMLATLYGRGKMVFGRTVRGQGRKVYWTVEGGQKREIGTLKGRTFAPTGPAQQELGRYIGERVLKKVVSTEKVSKGYGYDSYKQFTRYPSKVLSESSETISAAGVRFPVSRKVRITENTYYSGHILDTVGSLWPKPLKGLIEGRTENASVTWTSNKLPTPKGSGYSSERGGKLVELPTGYKAKHTLTFNHKGGYDSSHQVLYGYEITKGS